VPQEENIYIESEQLGKSSIVKDTEKYRLKWRNRLKRMQYIYDFLRGSDLNFGLGLSSLICGKVEEEGEWKT
jgi:hypothetical protein